MPTSYPRLSALVAGLFYAFAMTLAFPPFDVWPLAFVALVPIFFLAGVTQARPFTIALFVAIGVLPFWMYEQFWISRITARRMDVPNRAALNSQDLNMSCTPDTPNT